MRFFLSTESNSRRKTKKQDTSFSMPTVPQNEFVIILNERTCSNEVRNGQKRNHQPRSSREVHAGPPVSERVCRFSCTQTPRVLEWAYSFQFPLATRINMSGRLSRDVTPPGNVARPRTWRRERLFDVPKDENKKRRISEPVVFALRGGRRSEREPAKGSESAQRL